jgi:cytidylate kinase
MLTPVRDSGGTVTISASYGAGGSAIAPAVADALGLPFFDRAIPAAVASKLAVPLREAEQRDEAVDSGLGRLLASMAVLPDVTGRAPSYRRSADIRTFKTKTEEILNEIAAGAGGVILGRAAAVVLADAPNALHVRLDGPPEARVAALVRRGWDERVAREEQRANDAARMAYVRHFYRCDPAAAQHYHLVIDTTVFGWEPATDLVVVAARARGIGA